MLKVLFVTGNKNKVNEALEALAEYPIKLEQSEIPKPEIQDDNIENIALNAAVQISTKTNDPFVVEDDGLFLNEFGGFPGPYTSYVLKTIGISGILKLCSFCTSRRAQFRSALVLYKDGRIKLFNGTVSGTISMAPRGNMGFGFDPIFIPEASDKTFAEISPKEKSGISHRAMAFRTMANYLMNYDI
ncbi:MAG: XTP/dITP diphosphatase [Nitrososphaerota archaeon]|nr:XTP/dITP diphosphatase [Nitrososphaerota archaeon]MDG6927617.1 XTP/dITP diphosphatase [Nitrososphaerota archaeon]MDG6929940.1 XTP/dITP diphosphatase [Nitrososphaerota archaeon]MDG6931610.1 XTP/dITP diphosphatase [Nitrososphaerota archaeon]MDG6935973.1 XTP/dITP diphosphatase [Nitrososphaerota archaeon]